MKNYEVVSKLLDKQNISIVDLRLKVDMDLDILSEYLEGTRELETEEEVKIGVALGIDKQSCWTVFGIPPEFIREERRVFYEEVKTPLRNLVIEAYLN